MVDPKPLSFNSCSTFTPAVLDGSKDLIAIIDHNIFSNSRHHIFVYDDEEGRPIYIPWDKAGRTVHSVARTVRTLVNDASSPSAVSVVAILGVTDQFTYFSMIFGIMRAGHIPFPISPRNSDQGVANLLLKMNVKFMFVSKDKAMQTLSTSACHHVVEQGGMMPVHLACPTFASLYNIPEEGFEFMPPVHIPSVDYPAVILHSSGSTSFPKPITLTHNALIQWCQTPYYGPLKFCDKTLSSHALPFFHAMGLSCIMWGVGSGATLSNFAPHDPPVVSSSDTVYTGAIATKSNLIFCVPTFLEQWLNEPERVTALLKFHGVYFGGGPINKKIGDTWAALGAKLAPVYGATETGVASSFPPRYLPVEDWEYFELSDHVQGELVLHDEEQRIFQLLLKSCSSHTPCILNADVSGTPAYNTNDLLIQHPTNPQLWKVYGRADDQIMHSTGEKTNPVPMESIINTDPKVNASVIFGRGRFHAGVLIEPAQEWAFDPSDLDRLATYRNEIWPSVEKANEFAPSHSRIFKEMIIITKPTKPFQYTPKGTARRQMNTQAYEEEIIACYDAVEESAQADIAAPGSWDAQSTRDFVRRLLMKVIEIDSLQDEEDIFQCGCDSLKATWIRNSILHVLRASTQVSIKNIPENFVYSNHTVSKLTSYLLGHTVSLSSPGTVDATSEALREIEAMVQKYTVDIPFPQRSPSHSGDIPTKEVILLTGSTGGLGSYMLEYSLKLASVSRVYAFNRVDRNGRCSRDRQREAFYDRGIDFSLLDSPKLVFLEGNLEQPFLGLDPVVYETIKLAVTAILHTSWRVDFNLPLSSMEPLIAGTRQLLDLALQSPNAAPPSFVFASSIGVLKNWTADTEVPEEPLPDPRIALGSGYSESKWVVERVLTKAAEVTSLRPTYVRIGQLSGGKNGSWQTSQWLPSIVRSGQALRCLPIVPGLVSWIPMSVAACAMVEMRKSGALVAHIVHPNPCTWRCLLITVSEAFGVPMVPYADWLAALEASEPTDDSQKVVQTAYEENPALYLVDFYRIAGQTLGTETTEAMGYPRLSTAVAVKEAPSLIGGRLRSLGPADVAQWLHYWKGKNLLDDYRPIQLHVAAVPTVQAM